ncbi:MAG TPA: glycosyltransferase family 4 protein [Bacillota bacterium]|nr:glycosyltransferase family 4 protein [Bacillota bacterium]HPT86951.1 glycosyltransferase family 4 protein [Bacillota bacterium]
MRILMQNRVTSRHAIAGDTIQMRKTGEYLRKLGLEVVFDFTLEPDVSGFDLVHLFNTIPIEDTYQQFRNAKRNRAKIVLSTVFWDPAEYLRYRKDPAAFVSWWEETQVLRQEVLAGVDLILPNSHAELALLRKTYVNLPPAVVIPNGADSSFAYANSERFCRRWGRKDFVLSVGRISPRKNQLALIEAAGKLHLPLVLIGPLNDGLYYQECRQKAAGIDCCFIDTMNPAELASAYAAARVHALVSWYDTPGLVSLEAALAGCAIVTTDRGSAAEYFGEHAFYCQPDDVESICCALEAAWKAGPDPLLAQKVMKNYTWEKVADQTFAAYRLCFDRD